MASSRWKTIAKAALPVVLAGAFMMPGPAPDVAVSGATADPPAWLLTEMNHLVSHGGRWITDNSPWISDDEPWQQYGMEWRQGTEAGVITGRLFGLANGTEQTFWEFRMYWEEERQQAVIWQRGGDGTIGTGPLRPSGNGEMEAIQVFTAPDGTTSTIRHLSTTTDETHATRSFQRVEGEWQPRRQYVWTKEAGYSF